MGRARSTWWSFRACLVFPAARVVPLADARVGKNAKAVHGLISEYSIDVGRKAGFTELLGYVKKVLGLL